MNSEAQAKLLQFKSFTIAHPQFREALNTINRSIQATKLRGEPSCALLLGEPGTGKTRVCDHVIAKLDQASTLKVKGGLQELYPSIYCIIPNNVTIKGVVVALLQCFQTDSTYQPMWALENRLRALLTSCQTELIFLDELQHLLRRGAIRTQESVCDWIKVLTDLFRGEVILVGTPVCEEIIKYHSALSGRFPHIARLNPFTLGSPEEYNDLVRLIRAFTIEIAKTMEFKKMPALTDEKMVLALYALTGGNMRSIRTLLYEALTDALERDDQILLSSDFSITADRINFTTRVTKKNPYEMSLAQLRKALY